MWVYVSTTNLSRDAGKKCGFELSDVSVAWTLARLAREAYANTVARHTTSLAFARCVNAFPDPSHVSGRIVAHPGP
jgi:hypothetical protein